MATTAQPDSLRGSRGGSLFWLVLTIVRQPTRQRSLRHCIEWHPSDVITVGIEARDHRGRASRIERMDKYRNFSVHTSTNQANQGVSRKAEICASSRLLMQVVIQHNRCQLSRLDPLQDPHGLSGAFRFHQDNVIRKPVSDFLYPSKIVFDQKNPDLFHNSPFCCFPIQRRKANNRLPDQLTDVVVANRPNIHHFSVRRTRFHTARSETSIQLACPDH